MLRHLLLRSRGLGASHGHCPGDETHCSAPPQPAHQQRALKCKYRLPGTATTSSGASSAGCSTAHAALTARQPTEAQITAFFPPSPFFFPSGHFCHCQHAAAEPGQGRNWRDLNAVGKFDHREVWSRLQRLCPRSWLSYLEVKTPVLCRKPALCTQTDLISVIHTDIYLQICLYRDTEPCIYRWLSIHR